MKNLLTEKCISSHNFHQKVIKQRMEKKVDSRYFKDGAVKKPYSTKTLSNKKSSASFGIRRELPSTSHLVQYCGTHTCTRQGRLRELRIRCVARKFLYLWIRMTFGRVFPSKARFYYEQQLLRKVFEEWKEEWWVFHHEWKLCVRADCHYRYYLYNLMFQTWKTYVRQQQEMRNKYIRAELHDAKQKMRQAWKSWLIYVVVRRTKLQMQTTALEFRQWSILRVWWSMWRQRLGQLRVSHALHASALKHRALSLQLQAWSQWQEQLLYVQKEKQKVVSAVKHHQHWQKRRFLKAWLEYLQVRRVKRQQNEMAERFHHVTVLQIHFCDWQQAWERRESLYAHHAQVEKLARKMALRRAFTRWKHYMLLCAEEAAQFEMAEEHHRHSQLYFCFRALKDNVTHAHLQQIRRNLAHQQHGVTLLHRFWNLWWSQIEQKKEREQLPLLHAAWDHYRIALLCKCIKLWLQYTRKRRYKQLLQARADGHFQQRALPAAFHTWNRLWRWRHQENVLNARATRFHRETLEKQVFSIWRQKMFQHRENRLAERMAILHAEGRLLHRSWFMWHQQAAARHQEQEWQTVAYAHHCHGRLKKAFCLWRESAQGLRTERRAAEFHMAQLLRWAWSQWRECLALRGAERQKLMRAERHHQHSVPHRALQAWVTYQGRVRSILQEVAARESQHNRQLLRGALRRWKENTMARVDEAKKTFQASTHYRRTICSKVLVQWREAVSVQIYYRQQEDCAIWEARKVLDRGCLRTWFQRWRNCSQRSAQQRLQLERAVQHHHRQLLLEGLARWKMHHRECVRKRLLHRQSTQLLAQRLSRTCFRQWRQQLAARRQEQWATVRALWFWAFSLQAKVWATWLAFVLERRRKKARLQRALQAYQGQLLQEGATRLLRFAASMKASRQQLQAQQQVQAAHSLHRAVRRCATLWKQKVLGRGGKPQPLAAIAPSGKVTFEGPLLNRIAAGAGDATLETKRPQAPRPQGALGRLAAEEPHALELYTAHSARKQPRRPHFLLEPAQSQRSLGPQKPQEHGLGMAQPAAPSLTRPFLAEAPTALVPHSPLPSTPGLKQPPTASTGPELLLLLPPSSFMSCGAAAPARLSAQPATPRDKPPVPSSLASVPDPHLLLPGDLSATRAGPGLSTAGILDLEAELEEIQQQLLHYQTTKQNLWSCRRQANSLRRWLELSREEPGSEDREVEQQVQKDLEQVEMQIQLLAEELQAQRQPIGTCVARIQALRQALC
nr:protein SFI1 homolog isoform X1 [Pongo abelii]XP_024095806.2 protein SFI1 homolog isoform X1 [Pongo abelii]XP_024095807.2 protein SFI1 homolog isoform X1 [Pongo abelii]XP_024095808.2 protein SFI1 homolog isoform X1 [Pongo abelii]XP_024095809.2 protein SFI1 homolog isoform X1 [Pongo abelii]XP_054399329.1 protein SFI1 homolog isoform X1 [Pongo abelii]XP_054399330.1 protein SFI1 homolog isoform X1 [Pongo abelii]